MSPTLRDYRSLDRLTDKSAGPNACWPFMGNRTPDDGYGRLRVGGRMWYAHRLAYYLANHYQLPEAVCHRCDNPPCVNPDHLRAGTLSDNTIEMWAKGRANVPPKLTAAQVAVIRRVHPRGWAAVDVFAAEYGVSRRTIHRVIGSGTPKCYQQHEAAA